MWRRATRILALWLVPTVGLLPACSSDGAPTRDVPPQLLAGTGLYEDARAQTLARTTVAYTPRYEFWADGTTKRRWIELPAGTRIDVAQIDHWAFPVGTKVWKELRLHGRPIETRLLWKVREGTGPGAWTMVAYAWNEAGSEAVLAAADGVVDAAATAHDVPTQSDCVNCHQHVRDVVIGVSALQLGGTGASTLRTWADAGRLSSPIASDAEPPGTGATRDALAYLHANCGHCHNDEAGALATQSALRLRLLVGDQTEEQTGARRTAATVMRHPLPGSTRVLVPGSPEASGIWLRMGTRDAYAMPPSGTELVDELGRETVRRWIAEMR